MKEANWNHLENTMASAVSPPGHTQSEGSSPPSGHKDKFKDNIPRQIKRQHSQLTILYLSDMLGQVQVAHMVLIAQTSAPTVEQHSSEVLCLGPCYHLVENKIRNSLRSLRNHKLPCGKRSTFSLPARWTPFSPVTSSNCLPQQAIQSGFTCFVACDFYVMSTNQQLNKSAVHRRDITWSIASARRAGLRRTVRQHI